MKSKTKTEIAIESLKDIDEAIVFIQSNLADTSYLYKQKLIGKQE